MLEVIIEFAKLFGAIVDVSVVAFIGWAVVSLILDWVLGR